MDWVVHGYKFNVEFNFGIVDVSSGMKRVEASKEAFRNLIVISEDGFTEYHRVVLEPSNWAEFVKEKVQNWNQQHAKATPAEIKAEIKRLKNLLISHTALKDSVAKNTFHAVIPVDNNEADEKLHKAYTDAYALVESANKATLAGSLLTAAVKSQDQKSASKGDDAFSRLVDQQAQWKASSLKSNKRAITDLQKQEQGEVSTYLQTRITTITKEIQELEDLLPLSKVFAPEVLTDGGTTVAAEDLKKNAGKTREL
ncbi:hypothetical protein MMC17_003037 [Xylographa soralifera]|nr:hypothetical protein [Xylographa soralifera]